MRLIKSFGYAWNGIKTCISTESNFRIHISLSILVIIAGCFLNINPLEWIMIFVSIGFVLCMEMLNTAVEKLCDLVHKEIHPIIKTVKDIAAGAVMLSTFIAIICGAIIFIPKIYFLIKSMNLL